MSLNETISAKSDLGLLSKSQNPLAIMPSGDIINVRPSLGIESDKNSPTTISNIVKYMKNRSSSIQPITPQDILSYATKKSKSITISNLKKHKKILLISLIISIIGLCIGYMIFRTLHQKNIESITNTYISDAKHISESIYIKLQYMVTTNNIVSLSIQKYITTNTLNSTTFRNIVNNSLSNDKTYIDNLIYISNYYNGTLDLLCEYVPSDLYAKKYLDAILYNMSNVKKSFIVINENVESIIYSIHSIYNSDMQIIGYIVAYTNLKTYKYNYFDIDIVYHIDSDKNTSFNTITENKKIKTTITILNLQISIKYILHDIKYSKIIIITVILIILLILIMSVMYVYYNVIIKDLKNMIKHKIIVEKLVPDYLMTKVLDNPTETHAYTYDSLSVIFIDVVGFTKRTDKVTKQDNNICNNSGIKALFADLSYIFTTFTTICNKNKVWRIKTIGDGYMAAAGILPSIKGNNAISAIETVFKILDGLDIIR